MSHQKLWRLPSWIRLTGLALLLGFLLTGGTLTSGIAHAQPATTTTITDCTDDTQLQNAVFNAVSGDTINFACSGDIKLLTALSIATNLTLDGSGQSVTLDGNNSGVVLVVNNGINFTLKALTIAHGNVAGGDGAGLLNTGTTNISDSTFSNNSASGGVNYNSDEGGGIFNNGTLSITNSTFASNSAAGGGSGIFNDKGSSLTISDSTFTNNSGYVGGGLYNNGGSVSITNSTFANNSAGNYIGGGLYNYQGTVGISNSTFAYNSASNGGGGLYGENGSTLTISESVVADNTGFGGNCRFGTSLSDQGYNLSSDSSCGFTASTDQQNTNPQLATTLANNGGPTQTLALLSNSPAIDKIPTSSCTVSTDQRGASRPDDNETSCDIGAYESNYPPDNDLALTGVPSNITVSTTNAQGTNVTYTLPTVVDEDSPLPTVSCTPASGSTFPIGTTTVTCTVSDSDDINSPVTASFKVSVLFSSFTITNCSDDSQLQNVISNAASGATITFSCSGDIKLSKTLTIATNLTLDGSGQSVTLDGSNSVRVLAVNSGVAFNLNALTIANGNVVSFSGGGLFNDGGTVSISSSTFANNSALQGGGLSTQNGTVTISNSTFANNSTPSNSGAGLFIENGTVTISSSTFVANSAGALGGGLYNHGSLTISNSTFFNNTANSGGGLFNDGTSTSISSSTFANNTAAKGGGLFNNGGSIHSGGSIVANNVGSNCNGSVSDQGYNLESGSDCGFTGTGSLQNTNPKLDPNGLQNNGGPTQTIALQQGSPAIDQIPVGNCPATDQRGNVRPDDAESTCDMGAYESNYQVDSDLGLTNIPANIATNATSPQGAVVTYTLPTVVDEDSPLPAVSCTPASGSTFPIGITTVNCTVSDSDDINSPVSQTFTVTVKPVLTVSGTSVSAVEGSTFNGVVATGTAYGTSNPLTATITWGDGSSSTVSVTPASDGSYSVSASHTYAEEGQQSINIAVSDNSSLHTSTTSPATVSDAALTLTRFATGPFGHLRAYLTATYTDADPAGQVFDYTATITWGDGATSTVKVGNNPFGKGFALASLHSYARKGSYTVTLTVTDSGGSHFTKTVSVTVR